MKIFDCFTIFNELDLLEARLEYLYPYVDNFVLVESNKTHSDEEKPLYFDINKDRYSKFLDKIIHIKALNCPITHGQGWAIENYHRNCIYDGISNASPEDVILISDLDEIPNHQNFPFLLSYDFSQSIGVSLVHQHYNYYVNIYSPVNPAIGTVATKRKNITQTNPPQYFRNIKDSLPRLFGGGWHLSYLGGVERIRGKFLTSCDVADKSEIPDSNEIKRRLYNKLQNGQFNIRHNVNHPVVYVKNPCMPPSITQEKYPHFYIDSLENIK